MFFWNSLAFWWSNRFSNLISGSSASSKSRLNIWKFMVHVLLKPGLENFEHCFTSVWDACNCAVVWAFLDIALGVGMKTELCQSCGHCWVFQICWHIESSTFTATSLGFEIAQLKAPQSLPSEDPSSFSPCDPDLLMSSDLSLRNRSYVMPRFFWVPRQRSSKPFLEKYSLSCTGTKPCFQPDPSLEVTAFQVSTRLPPSPTDTSLLVPFLRAAKLSEIKRKQI